MGSSSETRQRDQAELHPARSLPSHTLTSWPGEVPMGPRGKHSEPEALLGKQLNTLWSRDSEPQFQCQKVCRGVSLRLRWDLWE